MANQARLNGVEYEFLYTGSPMNPGALDVATNGDTVEVLEDIVFASTGSAGQRSSIYVYDKDITLDLRSHVLSFTATQDTNKATAIEFKNSKSTIKNGTIHTENGCGGVYADAGADLVLECNIDQNGSAAGQPFYRYAAITTANNTDAKITINSGNYSAENIAIMAKAGTSITVNNGVITSKNHNSDSDIIN